MLASKDHFQQQTEEALAFARYYSVKSTKEEAKTANMRHLVWERVPGVTVKGKARCTDPSYAIIAADSTAKRVCICPHFNTWTEAAPENLLLNDVLGLWPDSYSLSHFQHGLHQQAQQQRCQQLEQHQQQPLKRSRTCSLKCFPRVQ
ncbi:hypothetical protein ABBQ38_012256 [Trebouxia sp. C0009 RCD-2024]